MSFFDDDNRNNSDMPDLPGDPHGRDKDLYPPMRDFPAFDYWDEANFEPDFSTEREQRDIVIDDRFSQIPSVSQQRGMLDDGPQPRRARYQQRMEVVSDLPAVQPTRKRQVPPQQRRRPRPAPSPRSDTVTGTTLRAEAISADVLTGTRAAAQPMVRRQPRRRSGNPAWRWTPITLPTPRQMLEQAVPALVMAFSLVLALVVIQRLQMLELLWAPIVLAPSVALVFLSDRKLHPLWYKVSLINLATVGVFYPMIIVRQSYLRVPFVEWGNGTLTMPVLSTLTVVFLLFVLAIIAGWMSADDPEYAGILFLPAAMLVPFFAGATEIVSLRTALLIATGVFVVVGILTIVASMLPQNYPLLVAPIALALEFFVLPLSDSAPIFPLGAGAASKLLFFVLLASTVGFTIGMPSIAAWVRQVRNMVVSAMAEPGTR